MEDGFEGLSGLDDLTKDFLSLAQEELPKESKKFIKKQANQLKTATKRKSQEVGVFKESGNYDKSFKSGKAYKYDGGLACRTMNSSPHAHLIEYGHIQTDKEGNSVGKGFVPGFHVFEKSYSEFLNKYYDNCEQFVDDMLNNKGL